MEKPTLFNFSDEHHCMEEQPEQAR